MPESRAARDRMAKEKGVTFIGTSDLRPDELACVEYKQHVDAGGERDPWNSGANEGNWKESPA